MSLEWKDFDDMMAGVTVPEPFKLTHLKKEDIPHLTESLRSWYPQISVGTESRHLRPQFYYNNFSFGETDRHKDFYGVKVTNDKNLAGLVTLEKNDDALTIAAQMGVMSPETRKMGVGTYTGQTILEHVGRSIGAEMAYFIATLTAPHQQISAEKTGFKLAGIIPAHDRDMVAPGEIKRVFEAYFVKILCDSKDLFVPFEKGLTEKTKAMWDFLFGDEYQLRKK